jgi:hypothetical protein
MGGRSPRVRPDESGRFTTDVESEEAPVVSGPRADAMASVGMIS